MKQLGIRDTRILAIKLSKKGRGMTSGEMIRSVLGILVADGAINAPEKQFLQQLCQRFHISGDVVKTAFEELKQGKGHIVLPATAKEQKLFFRVLVQAAMADGKVGPQERKILDAAAAKMRISATAVGQYLATGEQEPSASRTMVCPKCGTEQPEALRCQQCGIFIKSYLKQQRKEQETSSKTSPDRASISLYTPSGTLTLYALPFGALVGLVAAAGAGWLYQLIITWNPLIYFNVVATSLLVCGGIILSFLAETFQTGWSSWLYYADALASGIIGLLILQSALELVQEFRKPGDEPVQISHFMKSAQEKERKKIVFDWLSRQIRETPLTRDQLEERFAQQILPANAQNSGIIRHRLYAGTQRRGA